MRRRVFANDGMPGSGQPAERLHPFRNSPQAVPAEKARRLDMRRWAFANKILMRLQAGEKG